MERIELVQWEATHGSSLQIGCEVKVKPACKYYEPQYDKGRVCMVTYLYIDDGGLNIGINEGGTESWLCGTDGYRFEDLEPIN